MTCRTMSGGVVCPHQLRDVFWPHSLLLRGKRSEQVMEYPVKPLTLAVSLWVVLCGTGFLNPE